MIRVSVMYPNTEGATFDMDYYKDTHMKLVRDGLGAKLVKSEIDKPVGAGAPGQKPAFIGIGHLFFESTADFQSGMGAAGAQLMADIPNFTNTQPQLLVSEVVE